VVVLDIHVYVDVHIRVNLLPWPTRLYYEMCVVFNIEGRGAGEDINKYRCGGGNINEYE
jgi:hypothetical protein